MRSDNKRIAYNTMILYVKLALSIVIGLYTSRVVLLALGASDYGLYAVVGGIVMLMNFFGSTMLSTSYRFLAIEMGKGERGDLNRIYNTVFIIHVGLAVLLILLGESVGCWYIENYLNVDKSRIPDALFVLHWSLVAGAFSVLAVPSNGLLIARENFLFTSVCEIGRMLFKLGFVIWLAHYFGNRLRVYAVIMCVFNLIVPLSNTIYCQIKERKVVKFHLNKRKKDYKEIFGYCVWNVFGAAASMGQSQGSTIIINLFFTTVMNAAYSIATQVNGYVQMLVRSLGQATVPQIMKNYSAGNQQRSLQLVFMICRYTFFMMIIPAATLIVSLDEVLKLWLKNPPAYTSGFVFFMLINALVYTLECGFDTLIQSTGRIRTNQIGYSLILIMLLPISYVLYKYQASVYSITIVNIFLSACIVVFHSILLSRMTEFTFSAYTHKTLIPALKVAVVVVPLSALLKYGVTINNMLLSVLIKSAIAIVIMTLAVYRLGLDKEEREKVLFAAIKVKNKLM